MVKTQTVSIPQEILNYIFEGAKRLYPKETLFLLRGKKAKDNLIITDLVVPPLAVYGEGFANYPLYMLPTDFSIVGSVHSHPSGDKRPSHVDMNNFYGRILMIAGYPYIEKQDIVAYNSEGQELPITVT
jgi:proteasome lid subunit RPN8/RPN11